MKKLSIFLAALAVFSGNRAGAVCDRPQPRLVCAEYYASNVVIEATLLRSQALHDKDDPEGISAYLYTLRPDQVLRGQISSPFTVYEGNDSGRASFNWKVGSHYLLFLFHSYEGSGWSLDGCGNSNVLADASRSLAEIARIDPQNNTGKILGVVSGDMPDTPVPDKRVVISSSDQEFVAVTDQQGKFSIDVPIGSYRVEVNDPQLRFERYFLSYENPEHVSIQPGGCAQIEFEEASKPSR